MGKTAVLLVNLGTPSAPDVASVRHYLKEFLSDCRVIFVRDFPDQPKFIQLLTECVKACTKENGQPDALILSYHGIPQRYVDTGDDYPERCHKTTEALQKQLPNIEIIESFRSKFGEEPWLQPSTSETSQKMAKEGKIYVQIMAPAFTADCLETLEELGKENFALFMEAGGQKYKYLHAANDHPLFIDCLEEIVRTYL